MKPYQKKYRPKAGKKNTPWTDADLTALRTMHQQGSTYADMANTLDRSTGGVAQQLHKMKKRDAAEGYIHVSDTLTTQDAEYHVSSDTTTSTLKRWWKRLFGGSDIGAQ